MTTHIISGGTFSHVRNHLALSAPAFGSTGRFIQSKYFVGGTLHSAPHYEAELHLTKMADHTSKLVTNEDVGALVDRLIADPECRVIYMNAALCDYNGVVDNLPSGAHATRLKTREGQQSMILTPADKIVSRIRRERKDIFLVAFKTTTGASSDEQYRIALDMLKANSCNLVLANDTVTRNNMVVTPEESRYHETTDRTAAIQGLVRIVKSRSQNTFTRSTVVPGALVSFQNDPRVPNNLRQVVNHLVERGAYKPFRNATVGHFAVRLDDGRCLTSRRKTNYTLPGGLDLVEVEYDGFDKVRAYGAKPSVGGQSQRIVFAEHPDLDCIVHAHVSMRENAPRTVPTAEQWRNECGSMQCGENTSRHLVHFGGSIHAVMLDNHGPNIVFSRHAPAEEVIAFIEQNFDLTVKTGGPVAAEMETV